MMKTTKTSYVETECRLVRDNLTFICMFQLDHKNETGSNPCIKIVASVWEKLNSSSGTTADQVGIFDFFLYRHLDCRIILYKFRYRH